MKRSKVAAKQSDIFLFWEKQLSTAPLKAETVSSWTGPILEKEA